MTKLFPSQRDDERICLVIRQHWSIFARKFIVWLVFVFLLFAVHFAISVYLPDLLLEPYVQVVTLAETVYIMFLLLGLLILWVLYYLNVQIVTNERVVDITQKSLLEHTVSELHLNRVQDVTAEVQGVLETFLDYGDVYLQTAGETERFVFESVGNPARVAKIVLDLYEQLPADDKAKAKE